MQVPIEKAKPNNAGQYRVNYMAPGEKPRILIGVRADGKKLKVTKNTLMNLINGFRQVVYKNIPAGDLSFFTINKNNNGN